MRKRLMALVSSVLLLGALVAGGLNLHANVAASPSLHAFATGQISVELRDLQGAPLTGPIMSAEDMAPGDPDHTYTASVANTSVFPLQYNIGLVRSDIVQAKTLAQVTQNDALGDALLLMVERLDGLHESDPNAWTSLGVHTLNEWTSGAVTPISPILLGGERHKFRFTISFPRGAGDAAQAGTVSVELQVHAQGAETPTRRQGTVDYTVTKHVGLDPLIDSGNVLLSLDKTGGTAYFHYALTNTGTQSFAINTAVDDKLGSISFRPLVLQPGETATAVASKVYPLLPDGAPSETEVGVLTVNAGDITKTATASVKRISLQPPTTGSLTVRVLNGTDQPPVPLSGATVRLSNGRTGTTGGDGTVLFTNQALDVPLTATASALNPKNPDPATRQEKSTTATLTSAIPDDFVTIELVFPPVSAPPPASLTVLVVDNSDRNGGKPVPVPGATVRLSNGLTGTTDANGRVTFTSLLVDFAAQPEWGIEARVWAVDPKNPVASTRKEAVASVTLTARNSSPTLTLPLTWLAVSATGPALVEYGALTGRVCSPKAPGARISAAGPGGQSAEVKIEPNGSLGQWRPWTLPNLTTGAWTITLFAPGGEKVEQQVQVKGGVSTNAMDFSLACTGEPTDQVGKVVQVVGVTMLLGGVAVLGWRRRQRRNPVA